jgi:hypothetical protein
MRWRLLAQSMWAGVCDVGGVVARERVHPLMGTLFGSASSWDLLSLLDHVGVGDHTTARSDDLNALRATASGYDFFGVWTGRSFFADASILFLFLVHFLCALAVGCASLLLRYRICYFRFCFPLCRAVLVRYDALLWVMDSHPNSARVLRSAGRAWPF